MWVHKVRVSMILLLLWELRVMALLVAEKGKKRESAEIRVEYVGRYWFDAKDDWARYGRRV